MKIVLSGIQPSGNLHLGNYLGAIKSWIDLQETHHCLFGIMNLHAITVPQDPKVLRQNILDAAAVYLACGLDSKKASIFVQSEVSAHAELAWVLGTITPMGWLNRMTQFKDKSRDGHASLLADLLEKTRKISPMTRALSIASGKSPSVEMQEEFATELVNSYFGVIEEFESKRKSNLGLYSYPVLMAADILLYHPDLVPVGEDQKQHLELTRDLAGAFNRRFNSEYFKLPEPLIIKSVKRIMSLQDGTKKMSKSDESEISRINLEDSPENIIKKVKKAKTDSLAEISYDEMRPEIYNLLNIFSAMSGKAPEAIATEYKTLGYGKFKGDLAEIIVEKLRPIQHNLVRFKQDESFIRDVLKSGQENAAKIASKTRDEVFKLVGLI